MLAMQILRYILFAALVCWGCSKDKTVPDEISTEKFDLKILPNNNLKEHILRRGDSIVKYADYDSVYVEEITIGQSSIVRKTKYYKETLSIKSTGEFLHNMPIGQHKSYNRRGRLVKLTDFEKNFTITPFQVIDTVKVVTGTDIGKKEKDIILDRYNIEEGTYEYMIEFPDRKDSLKIRQLQINGRTGQISKNELRERR